MKRFAIAMIILLTILLRTSFGQDSSDVSVSGRYDLDRWGGTRDYCFYGDYLIITGHSYLLTILDISDPLNVSEVIKFHPGSGREVAVWNDYAYVAGWGDVYVVDLHDVSNPIITERIEHCQKFLRVGDHGAVGNNLNILLQFDLSNPGHPEIVNQIEFPRSPYYMRTRGNYVFIRELDREIDSCGVRVWDYFVIERPRQSALIQDYFLRFELDGDLLVGLSDTYYILCDISDPRHPEILRRHRLINDHWWFAGIDWYFFVDNNKIYLMADNGSSVACINMIDVSNPYDPVRTTIHSESFNYDDYQRLIIRNDIGYLSKNSGAMEIIDMTDIENVRTINYLNRHDRIDYLAVTEDYTVTSQNFRSGVRLFTNENQIPDTEVEYLDQRTESIASGEGNDLMMFHPEEPGLLSYWRISDEGEFDLISSLDIRHSHINSIEIINERAYVASNSGFSIVDISDLENMAVFGEWGRGRYSTKLKVSEPYAYQAFTNEFFYIVDVSDPEIPVEVNEIEVGQPINDIACANGMLYTITRNYWMRCWDVSDPENPFRAGAIQSRGPFGNDRATMYDIEVDEAGEFLYMADGVAGLRIFDIASNPGYPQEVGCYNMAGNAVSIFLRNDLVYVAEGTGIGVYDASVALGIKQEFLFPGEFGISAYPNPFNSQLNLTYNIIRPGDVRLSIYDQAGRMVTSLTQVWQNAGQSQVIWDAGGMSSGNYLIKAVIGDRVEYRKVVLVK